MKKKCPHKNFLFFNVAWGGYTFLVVLTVHVSLQPHFVQLSPKLEYQPQYGLERATHSDVVRAWLGTTLRPRCKLVRGEYNNNKLVFVFF